MRERKQRPVWEDRFLWRPGDVRISKSGKAPKKTEVLSTPAPRSKAPKEK